MAAYNYQPIYGVEPYDDVTGVGVAAEYGGGAKITGQNLLVSLWAVDDGPALSTGRLLKPFQNTQEAELQAELQAANGTLNFINFYNPVFNSRTAARFTLQADISPEPPFAFPVLAILNPPGELKTFYSHWITAQLDNNYPSGLEQNFFRSGFAPLAWNAHYATVSGSEVEGLGGETDFLETFALTSGADGVFPTIPDVSFLTPAGFIAWLDQVIAGDWYWPVLIAPEVVEDETAMVTISWPHSIARGA